MMEIIGSVGVAILLVAFFANLVDWLAIDSKNIRSPKYGWCRHRGLRILGNWLHAVRRFGGNMVLGRTGVAGEITKVEQRSFRLKKGC